jgi:protein FAM32A
MKPAFLGGALSFKGDDSKKKKKKKVKHELKSKESSVPAVAAAGVEELTEAEKKALVRKQERDRKDLEAVASKSHRERVEEFNEKLGTLTELNDIPRVSILQFFEMCVCLNEYFPRLTLTFLDFHRFYSTGERSWKWLKRRSVCIDAFRSERSCSHNSQSQIFIFKHSSQVMRHLQISLHSNKDS